MSPTSTAFRFDLISAEERQELLDLGAVGDLLYNFFDAEGHLVDHPVNRRVMSVPIEQLRKTPIRIIASGGLEKVESLMGAIKLIDCNVLITDEGTAQELLKR
jgi:DNA-binding transcriptional regulator LsrR (DeoR family)